MPKFLCAIGLSLLLAGCGSAPLDPVQECVWQEYQTAIGRWGQPDHEYGVWDGAAAEAYCRSRYGR